MPAGRLVQYLAPSVLIPLLAAAPVAPAQVSGSTLADPAQACKAILAHAPAAPPDPGRFRPNCDSTSRYFGLGRPVDFDAARRCALAEFAHPDDDDSSLFPGPGILSMVYANGEGVTRNTALARRFVCENRWAAPAELEARLALLNRIDHAPANPPHFDLCATATSGLSEGSCQSIDSARAAATRTGRIVALTAQLSPAAKTAFAALQMAQTHYATLRGDNEVDQSGTGRAAFVQQEEDAANDEFLADLQSLSQPAEPPKQTPARADAALNAAYSKLRHMLPATHGSPGSEYGTLNFADVQETERSWLKLRDAWVRFLAVAYPRASGDAFLVRIIDQRTRHLASLIGP